MSLAFVFPGQGSQAVGMGVSLAEAFPCAREVFGAVDEALGQHLYRLMKEGPEAELTLTENAQPALMAVSLAVIRTLEKDFNVPVDGAAFVAGHSLGEYAALAAAQALTLEDAAKLLKLRGQAMQRAVPVGEGAMAALIGKVDVATAEEIAEAGSKAGVCVVANDNNVGNVVISGSAAGVAAAVEYAKTKGVRSIPLNVSAPFHSPLMAPAAEAMAEALAGTTISAPVCPVVANVTARPTADPEAIRRLLVEQVTGRVRWRESVLWMVEQGGVTKLAEAGAGKALTGMAKRIAPDATAVALNDPKDLEEFAASL
jgi:[acyl-carrier-protein] S-malonyltransferase